MIELLKISTTAFMISAMIQEAKSPFSWYGKLIEPLPWYLSRPLGGCYRCFTGQVCLWYFLFARPFNIIELGFFISGGILFSMMLNKLYCWLCK